MRNKPTEAYLRLQQSLAFQEQAEADRKQQAVLESARREKDNMDRWNRMNAPYEKALKEESNYRAFVNIKTNVKTSLLETALSTMVKKALPEVIATEHSQFINSIVSDFIQEEGGVYPVLDTMRNKTVLLSELADEVEDTAKEEVEDLEPDDPDTVMVKSEPENDLIQKIEGDEEVEDIADIVKQKVSRATAEFMEKNVMSQADIKDTLNDAKEKIENVQTGDAEVDEEIKQEATLSAKRKIKEIQNRPHGVFEQLVLNMSHAVLGNDSIRESYLTESNNLDMDAIVEKCTCIYTLMEMANTLRLKKFDESNIDKFISFDN